MDGARKRGGARVKTTLDTMLNTCLKTKLAIERFKANNIGSVVGIEDVDNFLQQIQTTLTGLQHQIESLQEEIEK